MYRTLVIGCALVIFLISYGIAVESSDNEEDDIDRRLAEIHSNEVEQQDSIVENPHRSIRRMHKLKFQVLHRCGRRLCNSYHVKIYSYWRHYRWICSFGRRRSPRPITHVCRTRHVPSKVVIRWTKYRRTLIIHGYRKGYTVRAVIPRLPVKIIKYASLDTSQGTGSSLVNNNVVITNQNQGTTCPSERLRFPVGSVQSFGKRFLDGRLNNKKNLFQGARGENLRRLTGNAYVDNISVPSGACTVRDRNTNKCPFPKENGGTGSTRPNARVISNKLLAQNKPTPSRRGLSDLITYFGQFLDHDADLAEELPRTEIQVNPNDLDLPIPVPKGDVIFDADSKGNVVIPVRRFVFDKCTGTSACKCPREHVNIISSIIDANTVYGSNMKRSRLLRTLKDGLLKTDNGNLPFNTFGLENANAIHRDPTKLRIAGDVRSNESPTLFSLHTLFLREHNRLAKIYKWKRPMATDEEIFQHARKILIAEIQAITFREYLPSLLGGRRRIPRYRGYNPKIDTTIATEFSNAAFRFGHTQVSATIFRYEKNGAVSRFGNLLLREGFFSPERVTKEGGIDSILRGAVRHRNQEVDTKIVDELRNFLFAKGGVHLDLAAINIQRGRETGLPDFNTVRKKLGLRKYTTFKQITRDRKVAAKLKSLYKNVNNIDLWVGAIAEKHERGSALGETLRKIILDQFVRIRDGDRFWYQRILSNSEIRYVHSQTLSKIIKLNTGFHNAPRSVFFATETCRSVRNFQCVRRGHYA